MPVVLLEMTNAMTQRRVSRDLDYFMYYIDELEGWLTVSITLFLSHGFSFPTSLPSPPKLSPKGIDNPEKQSPSVL